MPNTVSAAFNHYRVQSVDIKANDSVNAKASRDYLVEQICNLATIDEDFPVLYPIKPCMPFGSFARRTKVQPLDDVDLLLVMHGCNGTAVLREINTYDAKIEDTSAPLWIYSDNGYVNSTKVLNKFKSALMSVPNYSNTEFSRKGEAVVVDLNSYDWSFDVVPAFAVLNDSRTATDHFLIPDGQGKWKRTDPRLDHEFITKVNALHNGNILAVIRLLKYWNKNSSHAPNLDSYHLETLLLNGFANRDALQDVKSGILTAFQILQSSIISPCEDPQGLGGNLDAEMSVQDKTSVSVAARAMADRLLYALIHEVTGNHEQAITLWQQVFPNFPG